MESKEKPTEKGFPPIYYKDARTPSDIIKAMVTYSFKILGQNAYMHILLLSFNA